MKAITGIQIDHIPFELSNEIGVLLFKEFPSTVIYENGHESPCVLEWVDCSDDGRIDRYLIYATTREDLANYIFGRISHLELIMNANQNIAIVFDGTINRPENIVVVAPSCIPEDYLPNYDTHFDFSNGVETEKIISFFSLNSIDKREDYSKTILKVAQKHKSEILNIHIEEGDGVGLGRVKTKILSRSLSGFDNLYREVALDHFKGKNRGAQTKGKTKKERDAQQELETSISTEVIVNLAASYSVFIRPIVLQHNLIDNTTDSEAISKQVIQLIENGNDVEFLKTNFAKYSDFVLKSLKEFLSVSKELDVSISYNWHSPFNGSSYSSHMTSSKAISVLKNIDGLEQILIDTITERGQFRALNCDTRHFTYWNLTNEIFTGYFDKLLTDQMPLLSFKQAYEIKIQRRIIKEAGRSEPIIEDTIISCLEF